MTLVCQSCGAQVHESEIKTKSVMMHDTGYYTMPGCWWEEKEYCPFCYSDWDGVPTDECEDDTEEATQ